MINLSALQNYLRHYSTYK